jgi:hypothetical protein
VLEPWCVTASGCIPAEELKFVMNHLPGKVGKVYLECSAVQCSAVQSNVVIGRHIL